jgi:hypothetical protein
VNTIAFAEYTTPRRGWAVSEVRIIPVEYSEVITIAPRIAIMSWPISKNAPSEAWVASNPATFHGWLLNWAAWPAVIAASMPMETTSSAVSVQ